MSNPVTFIVGSMIVVFIVSLIGFFRIDDWTPVKGPPKPSQYPGLIFMALVLGVVGGGVAGLIVFAVLQVVGKR
jgi:uncharacterized membrane protein YeaQ/YmgE (transglycosylase-associated protein family)